jgi:hypothetical protein
MPVLGRAREGSTTVEQVWLRSGPRASAVLAWQGRAENKNRPNYSELSASQRQEFLLSSAMYLHLQARLLNSGIASEPADAKTIAQLASVAHQEHTGIPVIEACRQDMLAASSSRYNPNSDLVVLVWPMGVNGMLCVAHLWLGLCLNPAFGAPGFCYLAN